MAKIHPPKIRWFVEVFGATNEQVGNAMNLMGIAGGNFQTFRDELGNDHNVWEVSYKLITIMAKKKSSFVYEFDPWQIRGGGKFEPAELPFLIKPNKQVAEAKAFADKAREKRTA